MNIRKLACEAIEKILYKGAFVNVTIHEFFNKFDLSKEEKALFTVLVMGTVEHKITLAYYLEPYLKKKQKPWVYVILLMSTYQIVYMRVENHYVVNEAVELGNIKDKSIGGFINAVLRNMLRHELREIGADDEIKYLSLKYSYPTWLVSYLLKDYKFIEVERLFSYNEDAKKCAIRVNTLKANKDEVINKLTEENIKFSENSLVQNGLICEQAMVDSSLFKEGYITIQDIASQKVAEVLNPAKNSLVLDMCSAPGSKTAHMSAIMANTGTIYACDIYQHKLKLMANNFKRLGVNNVKTQLIDARNIKSIVRKESFDYILLDMPCSGLGVMGHKVDLKYNLTYSAIEEIIALQKELIDASYSLLKKGGEIVISTCTINKLENEENINLFIKNHKDMRLEEMNTYMPYEYDTDGFFIAKLKKDE